MDTLANDFYRTHARNRLFAVITIIHPHVEGISETQKYDFESISLKFFSSQFGRQVTMEHFIKEKAVNEPAELLSKLLSFLNLHGDHRTSISLMKQSKCRKCEKNTTKMSAESSITVAEIVGNKAKGRISIYYRRNNKLDIVKVVY